MTSDDYKDFLDESDDDDAPVLRTMSGEPEGETLPRRSDMPTGSQDPAPQYYSPRQTERDVQPSTTRVPRLGPTDLRLGEEQAQSSSDMPPLEASESVAGQEPEAEAEHELITKEEKA